MNPRHIAIRPCPQDIGRHQWMWGAVRELIKHNATDAEIIEWVNDHLTRPANPREIESTIANARRTPANAAARTTRGPKPVYDPGYLRAYAKPADGFGIADFKQRSPIAVDSMTPADFLRAISLPGERRIVFNDYESQGQGIWTCPPLGQPHDPKALRAFVMSPLAKGAWFLANPVDGERRYHERLAKESRRAEENLTSFPYLLLESDTAPLDLWLCAVALLKQPITAVYTSGGNSIHTLIRVGARTKKEWEAAKEQIEFPLLRLGACPGSLTAVRLSRLPQCYRGEKRAWQHLLYLDPSPCGEAIINQTIRREAEQTKQTTGANNQ